MLCSKQKAYTHLIFETCITENFMGSVFNYLCTPKSSFIAHTFKLGEQSIFCELCFFFTFKEQEQFS